MGKVSSKEHVERVKRNGNPVQTVPGEQLDSSNNNFAPNATSTPFSPVSLQRKQSRRARSPISFNLSEIKRIDENATDSTLRKRNSHDGEAPSSSSSNSKTTVNPASDRSLDTADVVERIGYTNAAGYLIPFARLDQPPESARSEPSSGHQNGTFNARPRSLSVDHTLNRTPNSVDQLDGKIRSDAIELTSGIQLGQLRSPDDPRIFVDSVVVIAEPEDRVGMAPNRLNVFGPKDPESSPVPARAMPKLERMHSGRLPIAYYESEEDDHPDISMKRKAPYQIRDMMLTMWSIITYIWDYVTDWIVAAAFFRDEDYWWFGLTLAFVVVPHLIISAFSLAWYIQDHRHNRTDLPINVKQWLIRIVILVLQLAPVLRYVDSLRYGYLFRRSELDNRHELYQSLCFENADAAMLRLFEAFMEAAPQLVLQIYILTKKQTSFDSFDFVQLMQVLSIFASWFSLSTAMASFHRAQRFSQHPKKGMSVAGTIMQFFWHLFVFESRVIAIALFTAHFGFWGPVVCSIHVICMIVWVLSMGTDFCPNRPLEYFYNVAIGFLYLFAFLNVKDTPTKWKYIFYYTIYYLENVVMISLWFANTPQYIHWFREPALAAVVVGFPIGIFCFMLPYYYWLHPDKGVLIRKKQYQTSTDRSMNPKWLKSFLEFCL